MVDPRGQNWMSLRRGRLLTIVAVLLTLFLGLHPVLAQDNPGPELPGCTVEPQSGITNTLDDLRTGQFRPLRAAYFMDATGRVAAGQLDAQNFQTEPCKQNFRSSSPDGALWLKFSITNPHDHPLVWVVSVMEDVIDDMTLFERNATDWSPIARAGRVVSAQDGANISTRTGVPVQMLPGASRQFQLRISGTFQQTVTPVLISEGLFSRWSALHGNFILVLLGFLATLAIFSVVLFRQMDAKFYRYYTLYVMFNFGFVFVNSGYLSRGFGIHWSVSTTIPIMELFAGLGILANVLYCRVLLNEGTAPRGQHIAFNGLIGVALLSTGLTVLSPQTFAEFHHLLFFLSPLSLLILTIRMRGQGLVQVLPVSAALFVYVVGLGISNHYFLNPATLHQTSSAAQIMLMRPITFSYPFALLGEAVFMMIAISMILKNNQKQYLSTLQEAAELRANLSAAKNQSAKAQSLTKARIEALESALLASPFYKASGSTEHDFLERARECVHENAALQSFGAKDLAAKLGVSEKTLGRRLREAHDVTPAVFIRGIRLQLGRDLILLSRYSTVSEVSYAVGFNSVRYFAKLYRLEFGETPSETLKSLKQGTVTSV